jgi:hypothetical protein
MHLCRVTLLRSAEDVENGYGLRAAAAIARAHLIGVPVDAVCVLTEQQIHGLMDSERFKEFAAELWNQRGVKFKACLQIVKYRGEPDSGVETILNESWIANQTREANV